MTSHHGFSIRNKMKVIKQTPVVRFGDGCSKETLLGWLNSVPDGSVIEDIYFDEETNSVVVIEWKHEVEVDE